MEVVLRYKLLPVYNVYTVYVVYIVYTVYTIVNWFTLLKQYHVCLLLEKVRIRTLLEAAD